MFTDLERITFYDVLTTEVAASRDDDCLILFALVWGFPGQKESLYSLAEGSDPLHFSSVFGNETNHVNMLELDYRD